jgi:hypothetical protein
MRGLLLVFLVVSSTGCNQGECVGTLRFGNTCVAVDPFDTTPPTVTVDPPLFTREVGTVRIQTDEPATIYYTIDGTPPTLESTSGPDEVVLTGVPDNATLRYFAIDLNDNRSADELRLWVIDREGPSPPQDFDVALSGTTRNVGWTPAPDSRPGGVLVARVEGRLSTIPTAGTAYAVGDELAPGITIVAIDPSTAASVFTETVPVRPGLVRYVAWGFDDLFNYGPPAGDYVVVDLPAQTAQVNVTANTVTVATPPSSLTIEGTATINGTTLSLKLGVRNDTTRVLFAPKIILTGGAGSATWTDPTGTLSALPFRAYGSAILPGTKVDSIWTFTNVGANDTLPLALEIRSDRVLTATTQDFSTNSGGQIVDEVTGLKLRDFAAGSVGDDGGSMSYCVAYTPDGRLLAGARTAGTVTSFDAVTGQRTVTATLRPQKAHVPLLTLDRSGSVAYALVTNGHPNKLNNNNGAGADSELVRLDAATLTVTGRIPLGNTRSKSIEISPTGKTLVIASGVTDGGVIVIDLATFSIETTILPPFRATVATFSPDGNTLAVIGDQIQLYTRGEIGTGFVEGPQFPTPEVNGGKVVRAVFPTATELWIGRGNGSISKLDIATNTPTTFTTFQGQMLDLYEGKLYVLPTTPANTMVTLDLTGTVTSTLTGFFRLRGHHVSRSPF